MAYSFDEDKYKQIFDNMYGQGSYDRGLAQAADIGTQIGQLKLQKQQRDQQQRMLEAAQKDAAKKERERKKKAEKEKAQGHPDSTLSKQIEDKQFRLKNANVDTAKKQSAIGKALNLNPDNNLFFDALDLLSRPINGISNMEAEQAKQYRANDQDLKNGKISKDEWLKRNNAIMDQPLSTNVHNFMEGLKGNKKAYGSDVLEASYGTKKGAGRFVGGLALDVVQDPLNAVGGLIGKGIVGGAKLTGKGIEKIPGATNVTDALDNLFVGKKLRQKTLSGGKSNELTDLERQMENSRLYMHDKSKTDVARAILQGGSDNGVRVGKVMEEPLIAPKPLDIQTAPNVLNPQAALDMMNPALKASTADPLKPLSQIANVTMKTVDQPLENGFVPSLQQKIDWGKKGYLNDKIDLGSAGTYSTKGNKTDLGVYGTWGGDKIATEAERILTSGGNIEQAAEVLRYHPKIRETAQTLIKSNEDLRNFASQNGIDIKDLEGYMAHFVTKEARKQLDESGDVISNGTGAIGGNKAVTKREIHDSVRNANEKLKSSTGIDQFFNPDAYVSTAGGQQRMINYVVNEATKKQIIGNPDFARALNSGQKARKGMVERAIDGQRYELTKGANVVLTNFERHTTDESINTFLKGFDTLQNLWKKSALFSAGFHARNALGNSWNMYVSGMKAADVVKYQTEALSTIEGIQARAVGRSAEEAGAIDKTYEEFLQQGLKQTGSTADFAKNAENSLMSDVRFKTKGAMGKVLHPLSEVGKQDTARGKIKSFLDAPFAASRQLGEASDEVSRFALFKWARDNGMTAKEAGNKVREVLFDYTQLTDAERKIFRRLAPFYTWTRKNAEFQIKAFMKNPEKYNKLNLGIQEGYKNTNMDQSIIPDYMKNSMAIPIPGTNRILSANLPAADLNNILDPGKLALDSLTPLLKVPLELKLNQQTLNGAPIQKFEGETKEIPGFGKIPVKAAYALKNLVSPVRNLSGAKEVQDTNGSPYDALAKLAGGDLAKKWNEDSFRSQADWKENERLQGLIDKAEKQDGKDVQTVKELEKQGVYRDPDQAKIASTLSKAGYKQKQIDLLMSLRNKVYNGNEETAVNTARTLRQLGVPSDVIALLTKDYLKY